jgi:hypothetical protein
MAVPKLDASISTQPNSASQDFVYTNDDHWSTTSVHQAFTSDVHVLKNIDLGGRKNQCEGPKLHLVRVCHLFTTRIYVKLTNLAWHHTSSNTSSNDTGITRRRSTIGTAIESRTQDSMVKGNKFGGHQHRTSNRSIAGWRRSGHGNPPNSGAAISALRYKARGQPLFTICTF